MLKLNRVSRGNIDLLDSFLENAGDALKTFRYFKKRPKEAIDDHLVTYLMTENDVPVCYGHLDQEDGKTWLGIAVTQGQQGKGFGTKMMTKLIDFAAKKKVNKLYLSVDNDNYTAVKLYQKFGFLPEKRGDKITIYSLNMKDK